jgi:hypothetical protein
MAYMNHELVTLRDMLEAEIFRLKTLHRIRGHAVDGTRINEQVAELNRDRVALCAAIVHRRFEASRDVVSFSRWVSGNGVLDGLRHWLQPPSAREAMQRPLSQTTIPISLKAFSRFSAR